MKFGTNRKGQYVFCSTPGQIFKGCPVSDDRTSVGIQVFQPTTSCFTGTVHQIQIVSKYPKHVES